MCGIAGLVGRRGELVDASDVRRMCQTIVHRGPDDEGIYAQGPVGLGMRRLSIIDLSGGHQPIHNEDETIWIVFNGEIYNFRELRKDLEARGHQFYTHSDTEMIVHLYEEMGSDCVKKLRGMFGLALYDERRQSLLLARDRLGKKPLYYALHNGRLLFGSEIKALLAAAPELADKISADGVLQYLYYSYIPDPHSAFENICKLPAGHLLEFKNDEVSVRQYWDIPEYDSQTTISEEECLEQLEERLEEAVRIRLISDVPLGAMLSGGVDSSIVVALMARVSAGPVKTFVIGFRNEAYNETQYARIVAKKFGTAHHELVVDPNIEETLAYLTGMLEEPFGDSSMLPTYHLCRMARQHVTVVLSGDGGDELFAGYDRYMASENRRRFDRIPRWLGHVYRGQLHDRLPSGTYCRNLAWNATLSHRERYLDSVSFLPALHRERNLFSHDFLASAARLPEPLDRFRGFYDNAPAKDPLSRLLYLDTKTYLNGDILTKVDRMSMASSLEVRVPMLDHVFVEWVASLPLQWKFHKGTRKYILKRLAERLGIPREVLHRRKQGFAVPLEEWMRGKDRQKFFRILLEPRTAARGYFRPEAVRQMVDEHVHGRRNRSGVLWRMLILELWHRNFLEGEARSLRPPHLDWVEPLPPSAILQAADVSFP